MNDTLTLAQLFSQKILQVPDYQRGYAWAEEQWEDLIEDLEYLSPGKEHFTGTVILHPQRDESALMDAEGQEHRVYHVVDGQQRLTTLTLFLDSITRALHAFDPVLAEGIRKTYIASRDRHQQSFHKLRLNKDCQQFFEGDILGGKPGTAGATIRSHRLLRGAREYFNETLAKRAKSMSDADFRAWVEEAHRKLTQKLKFLLYEVSDQSEVGVIFEVTNDRGISLSELEKVKNYLLFLANKIEGHHDLAAKVNSAWSEIFERLMEAELATVDHENRLLRVQWMLTFGGTQSAGNAKEIKHHFSLKEYAGRHSDLLADLLEYTRVLRNSVVGYCDIYRPGRTGAFNSFDPDGRAEAARWGAKLLRVGSVASYLPLLLAARLRFPSDGTGYATLVRAAEKCAFRIHRWAERRAGAGQPQLHRLAFDFYHGKRSLHDAERTVHGIALQYCPDARFEQGTVFDGGSWYWWAGLRYFLYEYEEHLAGKRGRGFHGSSLRIMTCAKPSSTSCRRRPPIHGGKHASRRNW